MRTGNQEIDERHDEIAADVEDLFRLLERLGGKTAVVKEKARIFLRSVKIHHMEEEAILQAMPGGRLHGPLAEHKKQHRKLEASLKKLIGKLGKKLEEEDSLYLKREVRRLLTNHIVEWDMPACGPEPDKT